MKRIFIAIMAGLLFSASTPTMAVTHHKKHNATAMVDRSSDNAATKQKKDTTAQVAFSDTTDTVSAADSISKIINVDSDASVMTSIGNIMEDTFVPICIILIVCFLLPFGILALIVYFVLKSRQQKIKLAEMSLQSGNRIPENLLDKKTLKAGSSALWEKGILKIFLGIGLVVLFLFIDIDLGKGIGFLVAFYGCGQALIGYLALKRGKSDEASATVDDAIAEDVPDENDNEK